MIQERGHEGTRARVQVRSEAVVLFGQNRRMSMRSSDCRSTLRLPPCPRALVPSRFGESLRTSARLVAMFLLAVCWSASGAQVPAESVHNTIVDQARYASRVALDENGAARGDFDLVRGTWQPYETAWHTGQLVLGLLAAYERTGETEFLDAAQRGGEWWMAQEIKDGPLKGMLNAAHGDRLGPLINFTTLSDGSAGLYALTAVTGNRAYADVATRAARFTLERMYLPESGLIYNILDPSDGSLWTDRSPHHATRPASLYQVARPNIEGSLYLDAYAHSQQADFRQAFLRTLDSAVERQHANGFWMDFEPNDPARGQVHPRFNLWYAEALLRGYDFTEEQRYLDAALKTLRATQRLIDASGAMHYDNLDVRYAEDAAEAKLSDATDYAIRRESITGSASAFAGLLMLEAKRLTQTAEFDADIEAIAGWLIAHRYPSDHANPQLAGSALEIRRRNAGHQIELRARPIATAFSLRFLAAYAQAHAHPKPGAEVGFALPLTQLDSRRTQRLDGTWKYIVDPYQIALNKPRPPRRSLHLDERADASENPLIEYEWDSAREIEVPSDWNTAVPALAWYEGMLWYRTTFEAERRSGERQFLYFEGANYLTRVWLNGQPLGEHEGGFTPFQFEATAYLREGKNSLVVAVDSTRRKTGIPSLDFDWFNYGGLTRSVHLVHVPDTFIATLRVAMTGEQRGTGGELMARVEGPSKAGARLRFAIPELKIAVDAVADEAGIARTKVKLPRATRWSPGSPRLYEVQAALGDHVVRDRVGLRTIAVCGNDLCLNGEKVFLRGISVHEERLGSGGGRVRNTTEARALLEKSKALGANFVRLAHYPHSEAMVRAADEMGLMVWSEIPVYWDEVQYANPDTLALARRMQAVNIDRDYNRASVILWSVANETSITPARNAFLRRLIADARGQDGTRPITAALNKAQQVGNEIRVADPLGADLDVIAVNQYEGWYGARSPADIPSLTFASNYDKPFVFSEFGADAPRTFRAAKTVRWSADYQAWLYEQNLALFDTMPELDGISPWILKDFKAPRRWHGRFQDYWNRKGLIDETGQRKPSFETLRRWYER